MLRFLGQATFGATNPVIAFHKDHEIFHVFIGMIALTANIVVSLGMGLVLNLFGQKSAEVAILPAESEPA